MSESSTDNQGGSAFITKKIGFMLLNNFTMISLASAVEPLRMANQLSGETLYEWFTLTEEGLPVSASDGIRITPDSSLLNTASLDVVIVAGGINVTRAFSKIQLNWLKMQARKGCRLGGICTGAYVLAEAGLLDGYDCSTHWEYIAALQEAFPRVSCSNRLFSIDRDRMTSTGGTAPLDMMLHMIKQEHGTLLCTAISEMFICDRIRSETDKQKVPLQYVSGTTQPKLVEVVGLMEANLEELIDMDELAHYACLSRRQLERLFLKYLQCSPSKYYLKLRLLRARQLLKQSNLPIIEVSTACGFVSTPHFSKCYREQMGVPPSEERSGNSRAKSVKQNVPPEIERAPPEELPQRRQLKVQDSELSGAHKEEPVPSLENGKNIQQQEGKRDSTASDALAQARSESTFGSVRIKK
ncbi:GlxA family transcriptional regulator [Neptunomonas japonica]|uniref:AraC family transcriptional regulator n=1 Tax=Neptunomonas japonica JAMM 1380 TaxID=1441457 RepID=A0A7R6SWB3_9GAMM|nr:GlxA family transcriptional regulator [Neptunomonas japonica]BBB30310.1 AraC family transcriptional regulator [Neptunomonas japonica JAMM 1380]